MKPDIIEIIGQEVHLKKRGQNYVGSCPFHDEKTASLIVSPTKQIYTCFGCGKTGDVIQFIMDLRQIPFKEAINALQCDFKPDPIRRVKMEKKRQEKRFKSERILLLGGFLNKIEKAKLRIAKKEDWKMYKWLCDRETEWNLEWSFLWESK